ncbi:MAG TPA: hypothetical protein VF635_05250 [Propionibacteriaceae bacterium]|jgi:hypothetical protein
MLGELNAAILLLLALGAVFWVLLRPVTGGQLARRRWVVDGRRRDADPIGRIVGGPLLLLLLAVMDLVAALPGVVEPGLLGAVFIGAVVSISVRLPGVREVVLLLVGLPAMVVSAGQLLLGSGYPQLPESRARMMVLVATAALLLLVAGLRILFAPLRASGAEARGAFLAVYGVMQAMVSVGALYVQGFLSTAEPAHVAALVGFAAIIALGIAVLPTFTTAVLGVGLVVLDLLFGVVGSAGTLAPMVAAVVGAIAVYWLAGAVRR